MRFEGRLVDEEGAPVAGARVWIYPTERETVSDAQGAFAFDDLEPGVYRVWANGAGRFLDAAFVMLRPRDPVQLVMRRGMTLRLNVLHDGAPVEGARCELHEQVVTTTDRSGIAEVRGVGFKFQMVEVYADGFARTHVSGWFAEDPGGTIERTVHLERGAPVAGRVLGPDGSPVPRASIRMWGASGHELTTDDDGAWRIDAVATGQHQIVAFSPLHAPMPPIDVHLDGRTPRNDVIVRVAVGGRIEGTVREPDGQPVAGAIVVANGGIRPHDAPTARTAADGRFELRALSAGAYRVFAHDGSRASERADVLVANGAQIPLDLELRDGSCAGTLVDVQGRPVAGAHVRVGGCRAGDVTDARGRFDVGALPPGIHGVSAAWPEHSDDQDAPVTVPSRSIVIVLRRQATIRGRVVMDGRPVPYFGVVVTKYPQAVFSDSPTGCRDADGRFTLRVAEGTWTVVVAAAGTEHAIVRGVRVDDSAEVDIGTVELRRGRRVTGYVRDATGVPIAGALVWIGVADPGRLDDEEPLRRWFHGHVDTVTEHDGSFAFDGFAPAGRALLRAQHPERGRSIAITVPSEAAPVELTLVETGGIDGALIGLTPSRYPVLVHARRVDAPADLHSAIVGADGAFRLDVVPAGDYAIGLATHEHRAQPVRVHVNAHQRVAVQLVVEPAR